VHSNLISLNMIIKRMIERGYNKKEIQLVLKEVTSRTDVDIMDSVMNKLEDESEIKDIFDAVYAEGGFTSESISSSKFKKICVWVFIRKHIELSKMFDDKLDGKKVHEERERILRNSKFAVEAEIEIFLHLNTNKYELENAGIEGYSDDVMDEPQ